MQDFSVSRIRAKIDQADAAYHRLGFKPIMTDGEYDQLKRDLRAADPSDPRLTRVGIPYSQDELRSKKQHLMPMGSLDNTDGGILGLDDWYIKTIAKVKDSSATEVIVSDKIDGVSIVANYKSGVLQSVVSRGNGEVGEDITANAVHFQGLPTVLWEPITCSVRGEAVLYRSDFIDITGDRAEDDKTNPRNICNGICGRSDGIDADRIRFVAFNVQSEQLPYDTVEEKLRKIAGLGFTPVYFEIFEAIETVQEFYDRRLQERPNLPYEIDGLVIELNCIKAQRGFITKDPKSLLRPKYARAIKFPMHFSQTKCIGVTITVGHTGAIIPTAQLAPVWVGGEHQGVTVQNALLTNYNEVNRLELAVGDTVEVALAGDIIPKIIRVVKRPVDRHTIQIPEHCPTCGDVTTRENRGKSGANLYCANEECPGVMVGKIHHWIGNSKKGVGILDIGDAMEAALYEQGMVTDPSDLYRLTPTQIENVLLNNKTRIGRSRAERAVANIQAKKSLSLPTFLGSLGVDLLGRRRAQLLIDASNDQLNRLEDWLDDEKLAVIQVAGLGDETRQAIRHGLSRCRPLIKRLIEVGVTVQPCVTPKHEICLDEVGDIPTTPFTDLNFVFTGTRECIAEVEALGGNVQDGIRKDTTYLVQKGDKLTAKAEKAQTQGVKVISLDLLKRVLDGTGDLP